MTYTETLPEILNVPKSVRFANSREKPSLTSIEVLQTVVGGNGGYEIHIQPNKTLIGEHSHDWMCLAGEIGRATHFSAPQPPKSSDVRAYTNTAQTLKGPQHWHYDTINGTLVLKNLHDMVEVNQALTVALEKMVTHPLKPLTDAQHKIATHDLGLNAEREKFHDFMDDTAIPVSFTRH